MEDVINGPARLDAVKELFKNMGAEITSFHLTVGRFDAIVVSECKDDETIEKVVLTIGQKGNVTTETMP
ncbi:GYD domain-containing protein, partial [candidate division KSB1 bacterium]|nr:GYD domain-containing protein [candidate division KSB1 bacterium]